MTVKPSIDTEPVTEGGHTQKVTVVVTFEDGSTIERSVTVTIEKEKKPATVITKIIRVVKKLPRTGEGKAATAVLLLILAALVGLAIKRRRQA